MGGVLSNADGFVVQGVLVVLMIYWLAWFLLLGVGGLEQVLEMDMTLQWRKGPTILL